MAGWGGDLAGIWVRSAYLTPHTARLLVPTTLSAHTDAIRIKSGHLGVWALRPVPQ